MKESLLKLSTLGGISGFEYTIINEIKELFAPYCDEFHTDPLGNLVCIRRCGKPDAKCVMADAHMDGIGLMVTGIDDRGFLTFTPIGGVDTRILPSCEVTVHGRQTLYGVIGAKPPHLQSPEDAKKAVRVKDMAIDVGLSADEARALVSPGDMVSFAAQPCALSGDALTGKYLDDRAGVTALLECLKLLKHTILDWDVCCLIAVQEEVGLRGAKVGTYGVDPDCALVVDVGHGETLDAKGDNVFPLGCGTVISVGPNLHPALSSLAKRLGGECHIPYKIEVDSGDTGTDAWETQVSRSGVPSLLLSIPLRYMHTTVETIDYRDVTATARMLAELITHLPELSGYGFDCEGRDCTCI